MAVSWGKKFGTNISCPKYARSVPTDHRLAFIGSAMWEGSNPVGDFEAEQMR